jgi:hypothetical protein
LIALFEKPSTALEPTTWFICVFTALVVVVVVVVVAVVVGSVVVVPLGYVSHLSRTAHGAVKRGWGPICVACLFLRPHRLDLLAATRWIVAQALQGLMAVVLVSLGPLRVILLPAPAWALVLASRELLANPPSVAKRVVEAVV